MPYEKKRLAIAGFEDEREPWVKDCEQPLEAWKVKEIDFPSEPPEMNAALPLLWF